MKEVIVLTRYLYNKSMVIHSLQYAIQMMKYEDALFWAYEIYYSGFKEEIIELLIEIVEKKYTKHPKLCNFIKKKLQLKYDDTLIATIIKNIVLKNPQMEESKKPRFVIVNEEQIVNYKTKEPNETQLWKYLQSVCEKDLYLVKFEQFCIEYAQSNSSIPFNSIPEGDIFNKNLFNTTDEKIKTKKKTKQIIETLFTIFREKWLYHASFSPIWRDRIIGHGGKIDNRSKKVIFMKEENMEEFYDKYNYEPDEQSFVLQKKCMGII